MGRGCGSCNSKSDDAVADTDSKLQPLNRQPAKDDVMATNANNTASSTAAPAASMPVTAASASSHSSRIAVASTNSSHNAAAPNSSLTSSSSTPHSAAAIGPSSVVTASSANAPSSASPSPSAPSQLSELSAYLSKVPLLSKLSAAEREQLASALIERRYDAGDVIVKEGSEGQDFYLIRSGQARVTRQQQDVATLHPNDYFGEQALVNNSPRMATITALTPLVLLCMSRERFTSLFGSDRLGISFVKRTAVSAESYKERSREKDEPEPDTGSSAARQALTVKTEEQRAMLLAVVKDNILFAQLTAEQREAVVDTMWLQAVSGSATIIQQGDPGDHFYVVERGVFDIFVRAKPTNSPAHSPTAATSPPHPAQPVKVAERGKSESFGELALLYNAPRAATVIAREDGAVWVLSRRKFRKLVTSGNAQRLKEYENFLTKVTSFEALLDYERARIAEALEEVSYPAGAVIVRQGDIGDTFFIVKSGEVRCTIREGGSSSVEVARYTAGNFFGERALVKNETRAATVTAVSEVVTCLYLNREAFSLLLGPFEDIFRRRVEGYSTPRMGADAAKQQPAALTTAAGAPTISAAQAAPSGLTKASAAMTASTPALASTSSISSTATSTAPAAASSHAAVSASMSLPPPSPRSGSLPAVKYSLSEFKIIGTLGKGSFGHVQLVRHYQTGVTWALKSISKASVVRLGQQEHMVNERRAMLALRHPFLIHLQATFQDKNSIYLLLEVSLGGELFSVLRSRTLFDEMTARFYAAAVIVAFQYMHDKGFIYRDLKPENLLLDSKGYLKITDFGFAKPVGDGRTWTLCGTPDYLAPEVVSGQGHGKGVDWWTLGVLVYEMLASYPPFYDEDPMRTYAKIMRGELHFPSHFSRAAVDLIRRLLHPKPTKRLGVTAGGASIIRQHPFFLGFDWDAFERMDMKAPIIMKVKSLEDLSNFEKYPDDDARIEPYVPDLKHPDWDKEF